ncbi:MAG: dihydrofolate reductase family protein [Hyphomonadaceae bacterium]
MREGRRIAFLAASADGFIADAHGQVGWLDAFGGAADFGFDDFVGGVDALLMGRRTFDQLAGFGGPWPYGSRPVLVLTHRPLPPNAPASVRGADEAETAEALSGAPGRIWIVGGGETLGVCLRRRLIDEIHLFTMPILLGEGVSLASGLGGAIPLALAASEALAHGVTKAVYRPLPRGPADTQTGAVALKPLATPNEEGLATGPGAVTTPEAGEWPYPAEANVEKDA